MKMPVIDTLSHKHIYENKWMTLYEDEILREDGSKGIYSVVEKPDFAIIVPVEKEYVYMVEQYRYPVKGRYWEFPQGTKEGVEISPLELAKSELKEETGLVADKIIHVGHYYIAYGLTNQGFDIFFATGLQQFAMAPDKEEQDLITRPFLLKEVQEMILNGTIKDAATVATFGILKMKNII